MEQEKLRVTIQESTSFQRRLEEALANFPMEAEMVEMPDSQGMKLVRDGTKEAEKRKAQQGNVLYTKTSGEDTFLVCLN